MNHVTQQRKIQHRLAGSSGVALFEFALMLPLWLTLIAGAIEIPRLLVVDKRLRMSARFCADVFSRVPPNDQKKQNELCTGKLPKLLKSTYDLDLIVSPPLYAQMDTGGLLNQILTHQITSLIGNIATFGEYGRMVTMLFNMDKAVAAECYEKYRQPLLHNSLLQITLGAEMMHRLQTRKARCVMPYRNGGFIRRKGEDSPARTKFDDISKKLQEAEELSDQQMRKKK